MNYMTLADCFDVLSVALITAVTTSQVLETIYLVLLIASLAMGIVMKAVAAIKDRHISAEEMAEIKKAVDDAIKQVKEQLETQDKKEGR